MLIYCSKHINASINTENSGSRYKESTTLIAWLFYKPKSSWKIQNPIAFKIHFCFIFSSNPLSSLILPSKILTKQGFNHNDFVILGKSLLGVIRITFFSHSRDSELDQLIWYLKFPLRVGKHTNHRHYLPDINRREVILED